MSNTPKPSDRTYVHNKCGNATEISWIEIDAIETDPFCFPYTFCASCNSHAHFRQFKWLDNDQNLHDYARQLRGKKSFAFKVTRCMILPCILTCLAGIGLWFIDVGNTWILVGMGAIFLPTYWLSGSLAGLYCAFQRPSRLPGTPDPVETKAAAANIGEVKFRVKSNLSEAIAGAFVAVLLVAGGIFQFSLYIPSLNPWCFAGIGMVLAGLGLGMYVRSVFRDATSLVLGTHGFAVLKGSDAKSYLWSDVEEINITDHEYQEDQLPFLELPAEVTKTRRKRFYEIRLKEHPPIVLSPWEVVGFNRFRDRLLEEAKTRQVPIARNQGESM